MMSKHKKNIEEKTCGCSPECECGCNEGKSCTCEDEKCNCSEECSCHDDCKCADIDCTCDDDCECGCKEHHECNCDKKDETDSIINKLKEEIKQKDNEVLLAKADLINYRKRKDDEISKMLKYCNEDIIKSLLPVVDNFERAIKLDNNDLSDELSKFLEGFKMIYSSIVSIFNELEVKAIDGTSKPFDPTYHQAVLTEHIDGVEPGEVIEILQKGYLYKDRVIRPAMVKVSE